MTLANVVAALLLRACINRQALLSEFGEYSNLMIICAKITSTPQNYGILSPNVQLQPLNAHQYHYHVP